MPNLLRETIDSDCERLDKASSGSSFWRVDLHTHSPASEDSRWQPAITPHDFVAAYAEKGVSLLAITDHSTGAWVDQLKDAARKYTARTRSTIAVLPGVDTDLYGVENAYYAIHGPLLARGVKTELRPSKASAHEGHGALGDSINFNVVLDINYRVDGLIPIGLPTCGFMTNLDPPLNSGGLPAARVWWRLGSAFKSHGSFKDARGNVFDGSNPTETDPSGKTGITFQARQEPANGQGEEKSTQATVQASFDPRPWIAAMGLNDARLLAFLPASIDFSSPESVTLEWHQQVTYELEFDSTFVTNTFTPLGTSGPIDITQHVHAVVPLEWSEQDQTYTGQAPVDYVLFDVPPIFGIGGDNGYFVPCPNKTSATGGTFHVLQLEGSMDTNTPQPGQTPVSSLELTIDPGTTVESVIPVCPPPATVPPGFSFPLTTWSQNFASAHNRETQAGNAPYIIKDWVVGSEKSVAVKSYSYTNSPVPILKITENTTITLVRK